MQFNDTTNNNGLIQDCEFWTKLGLTAISGNTNNLKKFTMLINQAYYDTVSLILQSTGAWDWDDSNYTDFPIGTTNLVAGQKDYQLPGASSGANAQTLLSILRIEVMDNSGNWVKLEEFDESAIEGTGLASLYTSDGLPGYYRQIGNSIELYPSPAAANVTLTGGLKVYFQRTPSEFVYTDTTKQPGIATLYHRLLSMKASADWVGVHNPDNVTYLLTRIAQMEGDLAEFYANENKDVGAKIIPKRSYYN